jgi:hypothetical protein
MFLYGDYRKIDSDGRPFRIRRGVEVNVFSLRELHVNYTQHQLPSAKEAVKGLSNE